MRPLGCGWRAGTARRRPAVTTCDAVQQRCEQAELVLAQGIERARVLDQVVPGGSSEPLALGREHQPLYSPVAVVEVALHGAPMLETVHQGAQVGSVVVEPGGQVTHGDRTARYQGQQRLHLGRRQPVSARVKGPVLAQAFG